MWSASRPTELIRRLSVYLSAMFCSIAVELNLPRSKESAVIPNLPSMPNTYSLHNIADNKSRALPQTDIRHTITTDAVLTERAVFAILCI